MNIRLGKLIVHARRSDEIVEFSPTVTFLHGPIGTGKSTVARLVDYCFGGKVERTPALQQEFVSCELLLRVGGFDVRIERGANDASEVRITWSDDAGEMGSVNAPIGTSDEPLIDNPEVCNLSDLLFWLSGVAPIKVRSSKTDPDSRLVRLSFRDLLFYCYLPQEDLDSSFFQMNDPFKKLKSRDAMRFITGFVSERLTHIERELDQHVSEQRTKRETVVRLREFMQQFHLGTDIDLLTQITACETDLDRAITQRRETEGRRTAATHVVEPLRDELRRLSDEINRTKQALADIDLKIEQREALESELITAKTKALRAVQATEVLNRVPYVECPECGSHLARREHHAHECTLCGLMPDPQQPADVQQQEAFRRELNERIDELKEALARHKRERTKQQRALMRLVDVKARQDAALAEQLAQYDTAYVAAVREMDRTVSTLQERLVSLRRLQGVPQAIAAMERQAGELQGVIDNLRTAIAAEKERLRQADVFIDRLAGQFKDVLQSVGFPSVGDEDRVILEPRDWVPRVKRGDLEWSFEGAGSGGKKTLFNVCYALAVHRVAAGAGLPLPSFLIVDTPSKNIISEENKAILAQLYQEIFALARQHPSRPQIVLIDNDMPPLDSPIADFAHRRLANTDEHPGLISYYRDMP